MFNLLNKVKEENPLVLHYTNEVTINDCANITLALGGSPLMSYCYEEVEEIISIARSVVINIGTMNSEKLELFILAGKVANKLGKPVILDPVGVFATKTRTEFVRRLLREVNFTAIKGNVAEIKFIGDFDINGKGVDSFDDGEDISEIVKKVANKFDTIVAATGKVDFISDGEKVNKIINGTDKLKKVTGTGCMTASLIGSYLGVAEDYLEAVTMGVLSMGISGEIANENNPAIGTFKENLMNSVYNLDVEKIKELGKVE